MSTITQDLKQKLTAGNARLIADDFIIDNFGDQLGAGEPWLIQSTLGVAWTAPIVLTSSAYGPLGVVGVIVIDANSSQIIASTPINMVEATSDKLYKNHQSGVVDAFQGMNITSAMS
jgi:hypothetical protein